MRKSVTLFYVTRASRKAPGRLPRGAAICCCSPTRREQHRQAAESPRAEGTWGAAVSPKISVILCLGSGATAPHLNPNLKTRFRGSNMGRVTQESPQEYKN